MFYFYWTIQLVIFESIFIFLQTLIKEYESSVSSQQNEIDKLTTELSQKKKETQTKSNKVGNL